jgi:hypothetical protein
MRAVAHHAVLALVAAAEMGGSSLFGHMLMGERTGWMTAITIRLSFAFATAA